ncbi:MAG: hypothetical protein RSA29_18490 [Clostridium sp.]|uniref:hypothetical protein n=1 Tax=Clostridium sp. TaxID=1506 RepID=UPI002FCB7880
MDNDNMKKISDSIDSLSSLLESNLEKLNDLSMNSYNNPLDDSLGCSNTSTNIPNIPPLVSTASSQAPNNSSLLSIVDDDLTSLARIATSLNVLKTQLNFLQFNDYELLYVANCVTPLLQIMRELSSISSFIMTSTQFLNNSTTLKRKTGKLKKNEKTVYKILDQINCMYPILECRIYNLINNICDS